MSDVLSQFGLNEDVTIEPPSDDDGAGLDTSVTNEGVSNDTVAVGQATDGPSPTSDIDDVHEWAFPDGRYSHIPDEAVSEKPLESIKYLMDRLNQFEQQESQKQVLDHFYRSIDSQEELARSKFQDYDTTVNAYTASLRALLAKQGYTKQEIPGIMQRWMYAQGARAVQSNKSLPLQIYKLAKLNAPGNKTSTGSTSSSNGKAKSPSTPKAPAVKHTLEALSNMSDEDFDANWDSTIQHFKSMSRF